MDEKFVKLWNDIMKYFERGDSSSQFAYILWMDRPTIG